MTCLNFLFVSAEINGLARAAIHWKSVSCGQTNVIKQTSKLFKLLKGKPKEHKTVKSYESVCEYILICIWYLIEIDSLTFGAATRVQVHDLEDVVCTLSLIESEPVFWFHFVSLFFKHCVGYFITQLDANRIISGAPWVGSVLGARCSVLGVRMLLQLECNQWQPSGEFL